MKIFNILYENVSDNLELNDAINWLKDNNSLKILLSQARSNFEYIATGGTREVYGINKDYIIKIALKEKDRNQNKSEVESYYCGGEKYLAKIVAYDPQYYNWLIMERAGTDAKILNMILANMFYIPEGDIEPLKWFSLKLSSIDFHDWESLEKYIKPKFKNWLIGFLHELYKCTSWIDLIEDNIGYRLGNHNIIIIDYGDRTMETSIDVQQLKKNFSKI